VTITGTSGSGVGDYDFGYYEPVTNGDATDPGLIYNGGDVVMTLVEELPLAMGSVIPTAPGGRLTLTSGTPVTTSDVTAATVLYFTPYMGNKIELYYAGEWTEYLFNELSLSLSGYTADKNYDIFIYNNSGTLTLESVAWTDDTTRATALTTQDGIYVKSGDSTRRYLGTIRTTSTTGQCEDSNTKRYCWNYYNQFMKVLHKNTGWSSGHTYGTATVRYWNNDTSMKFEFVIGLTHAFIFDGTFQGSQYNSAIIGYGHNTSTAFTEGHFGVVGGNSIQAISGRYHFTTTGYSYISLLERGDTGSAFFAYAHIQAMWMC